jgi:hypothetical protein
VFSDILEDDKSTSQARRRNEQTLYEPVARYLKSNFRLYGQCEMYVTKSTIPRQVKARLDKDALFYVRGEKLNPDIMGFYEPNPARNQLPLIAPGLVTVEVKDCPLRIRDIYQAKLYAEIFGSYSSFLISSSPIPVEMERFLMDHSHILATHVGHGQVFLGSFREEVSDGETVYGTKWLFNRYPFSIFGR